MEEWKKEKDGVEGRKGETDLWRKAFRWMTNTVKINPYLLHNVIPTDAVLYSGIMCSDESSPCSINSGILGFSPNTGLSSCREDCAPPQYGPITPVCPSMSPYCRSKVVDRR